MIPKQMEAFLRQQLPASSWENRLVREEGRCFMEFDAMDVDQLARLGIHGDALGPRLVACVWDEGTPLEVGGYLVIDNLAMGRPSMGGIRILNDISPSDVFYLARGMTLKNAASNLPYGGGKASLVCHGALSNKDRSEIIRRFARLLYRYRDIFLPGPDVGTNDTDMKLIAIENGLDCALSKPVEMGGNQVDQLGAGGVGLAIALEYLLQEMHRLKVLPQFADLHIPSPEEVTVVFQGFGHVGANASKALAQRIPGARLAGISDTQGYLYDVQGLPTSVLYKMFQQNRLVTRRYYQERLADLLVTASHTKFSTFPNDLLREDAFCLVPAAHIANYLGVDENDHPSMTVERMGKLALIIEGANTYSPDPARKAVRASLERALYRQRGVLLVTDYLVNSGAVIFAAQDHLIKTPPALSIPEKMLGDTKAVEGWLASHADEFASLAQKRRQAGEKAREETLRNNVGEFIDILVSNSDMLPADAAEQISIRRITSREKDRTAADIMEAIITIPLESTVRDAAKLIIETTSPILAVVNEDGSLAGVVSDWDVTRATAIGTAESMPLRKIMTRQVITAAPTDTILQIVRQLEYHEISAMPIVDQGKVVGMINTDLLSRRTLLKLLLSKAP